MNGGPSQMDLVDYKPKMDAMFDKDLPDSIRKGQRLTTMTSGQSRFPVAPSKYKFAQHGKSGMWVSELLPWTAKIVDEIALIKTVWTEAINHDPAVTYICTGNQFPGRASLGSWLSYGLGTMNQNSAGLRGDDRDAGPSTDGRPGDLQPALGRRLLAQQAPGSGPARRRRSGPLPVQSRTASTPPRGGACSTRSTGSTTTSTSRSPTRRPQARIAQYEMAFRMQTSVPELTDISNEPKHILDMYGPDVHKPGTFARCCLLARRLAERDVRFVQIFHRGWDQHGNLAGDLPLQCQDVDQATYAPDHRPQAARAARRHPGDLGRRVRPHGLLPGQH